MAFHSFILLLQVCTILGQTTLDDMSIMDIINATAQLSEVKLILKILGNKLFHGLFFIVWQSAALCRPPSSLFRSDHNLVHSHQRGHAKVQGQKR